MAKNTFGMIKTSCIGYKWGNLRIVVKGKVSQL